MLKKLSCGLLVVLMSSSAFAGNLKLITSSDYAHFYLDTSSVQKASFDEGFKKGHRVYRARVKSFFRLDSDITSYGEFITKPSHTIFLFYTDCSTAEFIEIFRESVDVNNNITKIVINNTTMAPSLSSDGWEKVNGDFYDMPEISSAICKAGDRL